VSTGSVLSLCQFSPHSSRRSDTWLPGQWCLCYECHTCQQAIPVLACDEKTSVSLGGGGTMVMSCPHCGAKHPYRVQELRKVKAPNTH
jgi:hypothetical protein